ncbi:MAG: ABC transporter substrate binding protein [Elusimicrobia bacterium]|nr:ABC transporter substrate binding protein [Elusimicrobiota bacterium]
MKKAIPILLLLAGTPAAHAAPGEGEVVAVLSHHGGAYMEAFSAFQAGFGAEVPHLDVSDQRPAIPRGARQIVAFGARAAAQKYPSDVDLVYCLAPGYFLDTGARTASTVKISMRPASAQFLTRLKAIQPSLHRLTVLWVSEGYTPHMNDLSAVARASGIEVTLIQVQRISQLPSLLRKALPGMDAFFLPPDPLLVTPDTLQIFRQFSWGNSVPMYATTRGLAQEGAVAAIGVSFKQAGAAAAQALMSLRAGEQVPDIVYPQEVEMTLNASAAKSCGITLSREILGQAAYLFP